jgi:hypothetical protein
MLKVFRRFWLSLIIFLTLAGIAFLIISLIRQFILLNTPTGDSFSSAKAWLDTNGNGLRELSERPLQGVCIWSAMSPSAYNEPKNLCQSDHYRTNEKGIWSGDFFAGSKGNVIYIFANAPSGYHSTTPPAVHATYAEFGFVPDSVSSNYQIGSRYEYSRDAIQEEDFALRFEPSKNK